MMDKPDTELQDAIDKVFDYLDSNNYRESPTVAVTGAVNHIPFTDGGGMPYLSRFERNTMQATARAGRNNTAFENKVAKRRAANKAARKARRK
jgi:hypothetical protein